MEIYLRTNYNYNVGYGHISRISKIYHLLKNKYSCKIIIDKIIKNDLPFELKKRNVIEIYAGYKKFKNEIDDADQVLKIINNNKTSKKKVIFVDDYRLGKKWEKKLNIQNVFIVVIDDFLDKEHYCDFLINTKLDFLNEKLKQSVQKKNKSSCIFYLGPKFAFVNNLTRQRNIKFKKKFNLTFYLGGSLLIKDFEKLILELAEKNYYNLTIIYNHLNPGNKKIKKLLRIKNNLKFIKRLNSLDNVYKNTNLFISPAGLTMYEAANLKIPSIFYFLTNNQLFNAKYYKYLGQFFILKKNEILNYKLLIEFIKCIKINYPSILKLHKKRTIHFVGYKKFINEIIFKIKNENEN